MQVVREPDGEIGKETHLPRSVPIKTNWDYTCPRPEEGTDSRVDERTLRSGSWTGGCVDVSAKLKKWTSRIARTQIQRRAVSTCRSERPPLTSQVGILRR